jgi:hypothetical protein
MSGAEAGGAGGAGLTGSSLSTSSRDSGHSSPNEKMLGDIHDAVGAMHSYENGGGHYMSGEFHHQADAEWIVIRGSLRCS